MSKNKIFPFVLLLFVQLNMNAQLAKFEDYLFTNRANDSVKAELGVFQVPEDRSIPNGKQLTLKFVRFKSTNPNPGAPIVYLAGGPGGSGSGTAKGGRFPLFMKLREVADVIAFDQRGTGLSNELPRCPHKITLDPNQALSKEEYADLVIANDRACIEYWKAEGHQITAYNTTESAHDIDDLRKALAAEKISLWGISYGSHLAFEYIKRYEDKLDKVVLASLEGPDETIKLPSYTDAFLHRLAERAKDNYGNDPKYPDFIANMKNVHAQLAKEPIKLAYKTRGGGDGSVAISLFELQTAIGAMFIKNPRDSRRLPKLYQQMNEGDFSGIAPWVGGLKYYINNDQPSGMSIAMDQMSGISAKRRKQIDKEMDASLLGTINYLDYVQMGKIGLPELPDSYRKHPSNQVNTLLLSGDLDGRTYVEAARKTAKSFKRGQHIIVENAGHDLFMASPEVGATIFDFFNGKKIQKSRIVVKPVPFD